MLERIQRRATRRMSDVCGSYPERLVQLNLTTLEDRQIRGDAIETFKCVNGLWDIEKQLIFSQSDANRPKTRHQQTFMPLKVPQSRLDLRKNFFSVRGAMTWNNLPSSVRECTTVNMFKNAYDKFTGLT